MTATGSQEETENSSREVGALVSVADPECVVPSVSRAGLRRCDRIRVVTRNWSSVVQHCYAWDAGPTATARERQPDHDRHPPSRFFIANTLCSGATPGKRTVRVAAMRRRNHRRPGPRSRTEGDFLVRPETDTAALGSARVGYRFYEPNLQRWLNRDPIGENGGVNLHAFVANEPVSRHDALGLEIPWPERPGLRPYPGLPGRQPSSRPPRDISSCLEGCDKQWKADTAACDRIADKAGKGLAVGSGIFCTVIGARGGGMSGAAGGAALGGTGGYAIGWVVTYDLCWYRARIAMAACYLGCLSVE